MHELSLTQSIIELAIHHANRENAVAIRSITVEIGALSGVVADAVEFAFDVCCKGTMADGAQLDIRRITGVGLCLECHRESQLEALTHVCPHCGRLSMETVQGQEMKFIEMEIN